MVKNLPANAGDIRDMGTVPGLRKISWRRKWQPTPVFLSEEFHGQRSLAGYHPRYQKESDKTKKLSVHICMQSLQEKEKKKNTNSKDVQRKLINSHLHSWPCHNRSGKTGVSNFLHFLPGSHKDTRSTVRSFQILYTNVGLHEAPYSETYLSHQ